MKKILSFIAAVILAITTQAQTVVDIIVNSPDHTTLEAAVIAAGLDGTLSGPGPFTVFAPTDAAFNALPAGTVQALLADIPALTDILTYHVVGATALSTSLSTGQRIVTVQGEKITDLHFYVAIECARQSGSDWWHCTIRRVPPW